MTITDEKTQSPVMPHAATTGEGPVRPARSVRRRGRNKVGAWVVAGGVVVLAAGGYLTVDLSSEPTAGRGRAADAARLQAQADAYFAQQDAVIRGRAADAARLQAQADAPQAQTRD